eukprot:m.14933 g.14933  ORF g.14933 m.14933 type:complete len:303 (+) comp7786_c0_seq1:92-1000(+)
MEEARALHWVFKVANRNLTMRFYRNVLGMGVLRHEEFTEGCDAQCNGPYDGKWSKSMVGYGPEDNHFVVELTYNYGVKEYTLGNDFNSIHISSKNAFSACHQHKEEFPITELSDNSLSVCAPGGYTFVVTNEDVKEGSDPVTALELNATDLDKTTEYWSGCLGMKKVDKTDTSVTLQYSDNQANLIFTKSTAGGIDHASAYGRVAFAVPSKELARIQTSVQEAGCTVITPLVSLDTPGKATVEVVILADVDGYEICFVGSEAFAELSQVDPKATELLEDAMKEDKSDEWWQKRVEFLNNMSK